MLYDPPCKHPCTSTDKDWLYDEYYIGERDPDQMKTGNGTHHWSGAESLERYTGELLRDCLHGVGEYQYRYRGTDSLGLAYEGHYFNNYKYGYGLTSYHNGRVFRGLYHSNFRWGPGVETDLKVCESVGLWRGRQLVRLTWKPSTPSVSPDLMSTSIGCSIVAKHRAVLVTNTRIIGEINPALELLKQYGAPPLVAAQNWTELYPKNCTDPSSQLYHTDLFERTFYNNNKMITLEEYVHKPEEAKDGSETSDFIPTVYPEKFYAWNNNKMTIHMMKHCYLHEYQKKQYDVDLKYILNGPRTSFKPAAQHELDCRTMLLACYLGHIRNVAQLINEYDVNPNVTDMAGNSAIMYAACGNQPAIIHFLVEAGARINDYNDSCCTPLGAVLLIYACTQRNVPPAKITQAILPQPGMGAPLPEGTDEIISEWKINRGGSSGTTNIVAKSSSNRTLKSLPGTVAKRVSVSVSRKKLDIPPLKDVKDQKHDEDDKKKDANVANESVTFSEDKRLYYNLVNEHSVKVNEMLSQSVTTAIPYIFEINDMVKEIDLAEAEEQKKLGDKKEVSKVGKMSRMHMSSSVHQNIYPETDELKKEELLTKIYATINQLLQDGADPRLVNCPQPALAVAVASHCPDLLEIMIKYGADVKLDHPQMLGLSPLDMAISGPMSDKNLQIIHTLLENGANADHRLPINDPIVTDSDEQRLGPTLLHVMLAKRNLDSEGRDDIREQILELLLRYGSDPIAQYNGRAAMDIAMSMSLETFDIFIESPNTNLNAPINNMNQSILVKMFYLPFCKTVPVAQRLQMLTNLLLMGADPFLSCQNGEDQYDNLFVYMKKISSEFIKPKPPVQAGGAKKSKSEVKPKKPEKPKADGQTSSKSTGKVGAVADEPNDYKQAVNLVTNCARLLYIRWIQAKLMNEIIEIVDKYKHRHWNMILKEYKNGKRCGLWLRPDRCLEIWDVLKSTKKRMYNDKRVLKFTLYIVQYHYKRSVKILRERQLSSQVKTTIEMEVATYIREHISSIVTLPATARPYVMPELMHDSEASKFNVCFECGIPLEDAKIPCGLCELVDFCSFDCMGLNIERYNCHPCSGYLKRKYFPTPEPSEADLAGVGTATAGDAV